MEAQLVTLARYSLGPCVRPAITHDNGFLDKFAPRAPTVADHLQFQMWKTKMEMAEAAQKVPFMPHNDLSDALAAYRHFLEGSGKDREFSYDRYVANDPSGNATLANAIADARAATAELYQRHHAGKIGVEFEFTSSALSASMGSVHFPYPQTENWQKAIGAHCFWICGTVHVNGAAGSPRFDMEITMHVEDMYNFNPGAADIATGIPDDANGIFEVTGLAKQYLNVAELHRCVGWTGSPGSPAAVTRPNPQRDRQPAGNRRARNRV